MLPSHTVSISQGEPSPPLSTSFHSEEESSLHDSVHDFSPHEDEDDWADDSDLASLSNGLGPPRSHSDPHLRSHSHPLTHTHPNTLPHARAPAPRRPPPPHQPSYNRQVRRAANPPPSLDPNEEYGGHYGPPHPGHYAPFGRGQQPGYQPSHAGGYPFPGGQMVHHGGFANPFAPISSNSSTSGFMSDPRASPYGELMQYPHGYYPSPGPHPGGLPAYFHQMHIGQPGMPYDPSLVPSPSAQSEAEKKLAEIEQEKQRETQYRQRLADIQKMEEENNKKVEQAKQEAARVTREKIEAERKADEERVKQHLEAMKQAEERARIKFEAEMRAAEARRKKEDEDRARAEEEAKLRVQAAIRAAEEARKAAEKKAAEEAERLKQIQADAKRKAEAEAQAKVDAEKEAAAKKAEDEANAAKEQEAWKKKIQDETRVKLEELAKKDRGPYIQFKDALGRKFSFPFQYARLWSNMEELIRQAFENVDDLAVHVQEGWYDLVGPGGEIILPSVWEKVLEPEWSVTMAMWPMDRIRHHPRFAAAAMASMGGIHGMTARGRHQMPPVPPPVVGGHRRPANGIPGGVAPPPGWQHGGAADRRGAPAGVRIIPEPEQANKKSKRNSAILGFFAGKPPPKKKGHKK